ncbi:MAG: tRNA (guanosine(46)-N7)-methyltransferase TrmB [Halobacteriovoraceae bacterium]|nr:tRNA (guanosine(46)-N7)-methyltransferase TrmB [Halobacteriovoraceae bacterium]
MIRLKICRRSNELLIDSRVMSDEIKNEEMAKSPEELELQALKDKEREEKAKRGMENDRLYQKDFQYKHKNPYHEKLAEFEEFVLRDEAAESNVGKWNEAVFNREAPLCVEIGTGYGHFMHDYCEKNPDVNFIGLDFRFKRSYNLARRLAKHPYRNFKYLRARGERIEFMFADSEVDKLFYFFPDPWPKKKHHKKRLFQMPFLRAAYQVLTPGGTLFVKTDHDGYAEWMAEFVDNPDTHKLFDIRLRTFDLYEDAPEHFLASFQTKFEKIFLEQKTPIKAFELVSKKEK